jgi:hypothetical protein
MWIRSFFLRVVPSFVLPYGPVLKLPFFFFFFCWYSHLYVSVHPQLVIAVFYGFLTYLQEIGFKGKKGKLNNYSSHFWLCALPLIALSGIYEYCIPVLYWKFLYLSEGYILFHGGDFRDRCYFIEYICTMCNLMHMSVVNCIGMCGSALHNPSRTMERSSS